MTQSSLTHTAHARTRVDVHGRMSLQLHAIMLTMLILRDAARHCVQLQQNSRNTTHKSSRVSEASVNQ